MSLSSNFPDTRPSLNLDFAKVKRLDTRITFTRASTATYYDGVTTAKAEENLLLQSQTFENASWTKSAATVTANAEVAPDGTTTADAVIEDTSTNVHLIQQGLILIATSYTFSAFVKPNGRTWAMLSANQVGNGYAYFDLTNGVTGTIGAAATASITASTNGFYRVSITVTVSAGSNSFAIRTATGNGTSSYTGDGTSGIYVWGAQLEQRSAVTAYTVTTTQPITNYIPVLLTAPAGTPRFDHNPVTDESLGFLIEEQRANLLTYSADFADAAWFKNNVSVSSNTVVSPDGALTGDKLIASSGSSIKYIDRTVTIAASTTHTWSVYMKAGEYSTATMYAISPTSPFEFFQATVNLLTGAISNTNSGNGGVFTAATAIAVGNGWWRVSLIGSVGAKTSINTRIYPNVSSAFAGDGFSGIYIWGAQLEAGAFPTSYIDTVASSVTRAADAASMTGTNFSEWYDAGEGTLYGEAIASANFTSASVIAEVGDGTLNNRTNIVRAGSANQSVSTTVVSGTVQASITTQPAFVPGTSSKTSIALKLNDFAASSDGGAVGTDTSGLIPVVDRIQIGATTTSIARWNGTIKKIAYYPERLSNAQLQALTS